MRIRSVLGHQAGCQGKWSNRSLWAVSSEDFKFVFHAASNLPNIAVEGVLTGEQAVRNQGHGDGSGGRGEVLCSLFNPAVYTKARGPPVTDEETGIAMEPYIYK